MKSAAKSVEGEEPNTFKTELHLARWCGGAEINCSTGLGY